jgi:hypothetical protein
VTLQEWFTLARDVSLVLVGVLAWLMGKERAAVMKAIADEREDRERDIATERKDRERDLQSHKDKLTLQLGLLRSEIAFDIQKAEERTRHVVRGEFQQHTAAIMAEIVDLKDTRDRRR